MLSRAPELERLVDQHRVVLVRQLGEVRPHDPVEDVLAHRFEGLGAAVDRERGLEVIEDGVHQQRQAAGVIQMRMGEEHVADLAHLVERQVADAGARVDERVLVHQQGGGAQFRADATAATQNPDAHGIGPCGRL